MGEEIRKGGPRNLGFSKQSVPLLRGVTGPQTPPPAFHQSSQHSCSNGHWVTGSRPCRTQSAQPKAEKVTAVTLHKVPGTGLPCLSQWPSFFQAADHSFFLQGPPSNRSLLFFGEKLCGSDATSPPPGALAQPLPLRGRTLQALLLSLLTHIWLTANSQRAGGCLGLGIDLNKT